MLYGTDSQAHFIALVHRADDARLRAETVTLKNHARLSLVEVVESPSLFLAGMHGARLPIAVAHGEGRAEFANDAGAAEASAHRQVALRFIDNQGRVADRYPANPNGSPLGITGLCSTDGRVTITMAHPERVFRTVQNSWHPAEWGEDAGWLRMFRNARVWLG